MIYFNCPLMTLTFPFTDIIACILFVVGLVVCLFMSFRDYSIYYIFGDMFYSLFVSLVPWISFSKALLDVKLITIGPSYVPITYYCGNL